MSQPPDTYRESALGLLAQVYDRLQDLLRDDEPELVLTGTDPERVLAQAIRQLTDVAEARVSEKQGRARQNLINAARAARALEAA
jgi:hypothetical protein